MNNKLFNGKKLPPLENNFNNSKLELNKLQKLGKIKKINNNIMFINEQGLRNSLKFINKETYSLNEVLKIIEDLDILWENNFKNNNKTADYIS